MSRSLTHLSLLPVADPGEASLDRCSAIIVSGAQYQVRIKNAEGGLIGYGGFYDFNMAVRYHSSGQLDTRFTPPYGYGQLGAFSPQDGFHTAENSIVVDTDNQRMLVSGQDVQQGYRLPCMLALSLKPVQ
jgi:hypothetical protein